MAASNLSFTYDLDELMADIMPLNQIRVKELKDKDNKILFENFAITEDDKDTIIIFIKNAVFDLVSVTLPITSGVIDAAKIEDPYGIVVKNNLGYNSNVKPMVENLFKQFIVASVLMQWYEIKGLGEDVKLWFLKLERLKKEEFQKRLTQLSMRNV